MTLKACISDLEESLASVDGLFQRSVFVLSCEIANYTKFSVRVIGICQSMEFEVLLQCLSVLPRFERSTGKIDWILSCSSAIYCESWKYDQCLLITQTTLSEHY